MRRRRPRGGRHGGVEGVALAQDGRGGRHVRVGVDTDRRLGELLVAAEDLHLEALGAAHLAVLGRRLQLLPLALPVGRQLEGGNLKEIWELSSDPCS